MKNQSYNNFIKYINYIKIIIFIITFITTLSGCSTIPISQPSGEGIIMIEAFKNMINYTPPKHRINWKQQAEFYRDNYPKCSNNQKAEMLMKSMDYYNDKYNREDKVYKVKVIHIYDEQHKQIWPIIKNEKNDK